MAAARDGASSEADLAPEHVLESIESCNTPEEVMLSRMAWLMRRPLGNLGGPALVRTACGLLGIALIARLPAPIARGQAATGASLTGRVQVAGRRLHDGVTLVVDGTPAATTDADGAFHIVGLAPGTHTLRATRPRSLCLEATVSLADGQAAQFPEARLPGGDTDSNNIVDLFDLVRVGRNYRLRPPEDARADLNDDGVADLLDLVLVGSSYRQRCPVPWPTGTPLPAASPMPTTSPTPTSTPDDEPPPDPGGLVRLATRAEITVAGNAVDRHAVYAADDAEIVFHNAEAMVHTVADTERRLRVEVPPGGRIVWRVPGAGNYAYRSLQNPKIEGVIIVPSDAAVAAGYFGGGTIRAFYGGYCGGCHGPNRQGASGPAVLPANLTGADSVYFQAIKLGRPGTSMSAWERLGLRDEEIWGLLGFLRADPAGPTGP